MGLLSINLSSLYDSLAKQRDGSRDHVANFLDGVAEEARTVAEIWDSVISDLTTDTGRFSPDKKTRKILEHYEEYAPNAGPFWRLYEFYYHFSRQLKERWIKNGAITSWAT